MAVGDVGTSVWDVLRLSRWSTEHLGENVQEADPWSGVQGTQAGTCLQTGVGQDESVSEKSLGNEDT